MALRNHRPKHWIAAACAGRVSRDADAGGHSAQAQRSSASGGSLTRSY